MPTYSRLQRVNSNKSRALSLIFANITLKKPIHQGIGIKHEKDGPSTPPNPILSELELEDGIFYFEKN